ncbi:hypothetical protein [Maribacter hydrothermalis]|nr:hypothetical protein [Maribacter hydrothermalis]
MNSIKKRINLISSILFLVIVSCVQGMDFNDQIKANNSLED